MRILADESEDDVAEYHRQFLSDLPLTLERLRQHVRETDGPALDGSVESLEPLGQWYLERLAEDVDHQATGRPVWWDWNFPPAGTGTDHDGRWTTQQLRLIDELHAYFASVLIAECPGAHWVSFRGGSRDIRNGRTLLVLDDPDWPTDTVVPGMWAEVRVSNGAEPPPGWLYQRALNALKRT